MKNKLTSE